MSKRTWTTSQKNAIELRKGTVLVSAAAGSGKTAVLVQRIIEKITDSKSPCDADKLLVVTFTKAAAAEMKERISSKIAEMIEENYSNIHLRKQQLLLKRAKIGTIHSFCADIVRENFYRLGISPNFKISDDNETLVLKEVAIENVINKLYEKSSPGFLNIVEMFSKDKDDSGLLKIIEQIYNFIQAYPFPEEWMDSNVSMYKESDDFCDTSWGKVMINYLLDTMDYCLELTENSIELCDEDDKIKNAYLEALKSDMVNIQMVLSSTEKGNWDDVVSSIEKFNFASLKSLRGYGDNAVAIKIKGNREAVKSLLEKKIKKYFCIRQSDINEDNVKIKEVIEELFNIVKLFSEEFQKLKLEKNIADFNDLEHWMIKLLVCGENGKYEKSSVAEELSNEFDEIMIDECQDINETQNMIFKMLSRNEKNLFMVGDVKQSIYGFRQAMPEIFLSRKEQYKEYLNGNEEKYPLKVILDRNFRSREGVLNTVNFIFKQLMSKKFGEMDYTEEEKLKYGSDYPVSKDAETQINIIEKQENDDKISDSTLEAREISEIIAKMISEGKEVRDGDTTRKVTYRDFCILLRSANKQAEEYAEELYNCGIPSWCESKGKFFGTVEVSVMLSLLRVIDNPIQDIPLISVLVSAMYGFTPDDLAKIRIKDRVSPLYFALKKYSENGDERCKKFLSDLDEYRKLSVMMRPNKLINYIYDKTGYLAIVQAMENGEIRLSNLRMLAEYAGKYEGEAYKGLSGFIRFIDKIQEQKSDLTPASAISETANVVRIMSIHRSKGLEFPICILAGCSRKFHNEKENVLIDNKLGLGMKLRNESNTIERQTMIRQAVSLKLKAESLSEELRVLYVALTRAKEKLVIVMTVKSLEDKVKKLSLGNMKKINISPGKLINNTNSFSDWILLSALKHPYSHCLRKNIYLEESLIIDEDVSDWEINVSNETNYEHQEKEVLEAKPSPINPKTLEIINKRFNYVYPYESLEELPVKLAASQVSHGAEWTNYIATSRPAFLFKSSLTSSETGTANHQFLQFADYKNTLLNFDKEIKRLLDKGFISEEQAKVVNKNSILNFLNSDLGKRILSSKDVMREYRFSVRVPVSQYSKKFASVNTTDNIILQGAIDCVFEENGKYNIVDYKTDRVTDSKQLTEKYANQLEIYKYAFEKCKGHEVKDCIIYSLALGKQEILRVK